ncbi:MAG: hypothetical protein JKY65_14930 [Planctomycetes bacterium]|nr:hypothetical protein [Planctomycetota bacterium]
MARNTLRLALVLTGLLAFGCASGDPGPEPGPKPTPTPKENPGSTLVADLAGASARDVVLDGRAVVLAGGVGGAYYELARTLKVAGDDREPALVRSAGSLATLHLLAWGQGDIGMVQADVLQDPRQRALRAALAETATPLFDEEVHVIVAPDGAADLLALAGKRVGIGGAGSGSATTAENLFRAAGVYDVELVPGAFSDHAIALQGGDLAAIVAVGAQPLTSLHESGLKVLDMGDARDGILEELQKINPSYRAGEVSEEFGGPAKTVAIPALLVTRAGFGGELDFGGAAESAHPAGQSVAGGSEAIPASLDGPSLTVRDPEANLRLAASAECDFAPAGKLLSAAWAANNNVRRIDAGGTSALALLMAGQAEVAMISEDVLLEALARPETARVAAHILIVAPLFKHHLHLGFSGEGNKLLSLGAPGSSLSVSTRRLLRLKRILHENRTGHLVDAPAGSLEVRYGELSPDDGFQELVLGDLPGYEADEQASGLWTRVLLVTRPGVSAERVQSLVAALYANRKNMIDADARFEGMDPAQLDSLPEGFKLHPGTSAAKDAGFNLDSADPW